MCPYWVGWNKTVDGCYGDHMDILREAEAILRQSKELIGRRHIWGGGGGGVGGGGGGGGGGGWRKDKRLLGTELLRVGFPLGLHQQPPPRFKTSSYYAVSHRLRRLQTIYLSFMQLPTTSNTSTPPNQSCTLPSKPTAPNLQKRAKPPSKLHNGALRESRAQRVGSPVLRVPRYGNVNGILQ